MKSIKFISAVITAVACISGCSSINGTEVYTVSVDPYRPVSEDDVRFGECSIQLGDEVSVNGQGAWYKDNDILISRGGVYRISGSYDGGCINISTSDAVKLVFVNADITNPDGCAVVSSSDKLIIASDGDCTITGGDGENCSAVYSDGALLISGIGEMCIEGGVFSRGGIRFGGNVSTVCEILRTEEGDIIPGTLSVR